VNRCLATLPHVIVSPDARAVEEGTMKNIEVDAREEASEVRDLLNGYRSAYEVAMEQAGLELPYPSRR
jgi:hypothetical protein